MNIISYNIRGLGRGVKWSSIRRLVTKYQVDLLCIQETKREQIDRGVCQALWGDTDLNWETQPASNIAGGLLCIWNDKVFKVERRVNGRGLILLEGVWHQDMQKMFIVNVYAPCDIDGKRALWDSIRQLKNPQNEGLWCVLGDFNSIRHPSERVSLSQRKGDLNSITEFNEWISDLAVEEVSCLGRKHTWIRPNGTAKSKPDRFFVSDEWVSKWPDNTQFILDRDFSDHCIILLRSKTIDWGPKPFRVLDCWLKNKQFQNMVKETWANTHPGGWGGFSLKEKLKILKQKIKLWNKDHFGDISEKIKQIQLELNHLEVSSNISLLSPDTAAARKKLQEDLWTAAQAHESLLRQKARTKWIKEGDCNSKYFHRLINYNRRVNAVKGVQIGGSWVEEPTRVKEEVRNLFQNRFNEPDYDRPEINGAYFRSIGHQQNEILVGRFHEEEIKAAVWQCGSDKSPGPDGLNFKSIKQFWELLKPDISRFLDEFHVNGVFPKGGNASFITLIPKVKHPQSLNDIRPISLIGCVYKIVAKILANRLKTVLPDLIDERQTAFLKGRHLLHGVLIANEVLEEAKRCKKPCLVFKVDYEKAYDSLSWKFLIL